MAKQTVLLPVRKSFQHRVEKLANEGAEVVGSYMELTKRLLRFAADFKTATDEAARLDGGSDGVHANYLRERLATAVRTTNSSIWSRWNTIGAVAETLAPYSENLPPQRDGLYEIALAVKDNKPVEKWIQSAKITMDSSVRDLRALRRTRSAGKSNTGKKRHLNARVTLCFSKYEDAADVLAELILANTKFEVRSERGFAEALKARVGQNDFNKVKDRIR